MKLRLRIATPWDGSTTFEHAGPVIHIGRDISCELALDGEANRSISSRHARIDLAADGATLADTGSRNGTLLNDRPIHQSMPLRVGDRVQLGYTGPTLTVTELDLSMAADRPAVVPRPSWIGIGAGTAVAGLLVLVVALLPKNDRTPESDPLASSQNLPAIVPTKPPFKDSDKPLLPPPLREPVKDAPRAEVREVGRYVVVPQWGPSMLLQRHGVAFPWTPLRPEDTVSTAHTLISLPGYRSLVALDSGVNLTLWGNVPEFSASSPGLESVVMLNLPEPGMDLDLTLERGRVHIAHHKPGNSVRVRLRFLRQVWDLTLPQEESQVCAELWSSPPHLAPSFGLCLFTKGAVRLETPARQLDLPDRSVLNWLSAAARPISPATLPQLPDWWEKPPDGAAPEVADILLSLIDWEKGLANSEDLVDKILTGLRDPTNDDTSYRVLGVLFLAALDEVQYLVDFLEDHRHPAVRGATREALRTWLTWNGDHPAELVRLLQKRGYSKEKATLIVKLLDVLPRAALDRADTYQTLIGHLDHENLAVRGLAFWHLANLVPELAKKTRYNPRDGAEQRRPSIEQWKKLIPKDTVPVKLASGPGVR